MTARSAPEDGDIVVREERREGTLVYVLRALPGVDQSLVRTHARAIAAAIGFAKHAHVRAWLTDGEYDFLLLGDFRAAAPPALSAREGLPAGAKAGQPVAAAMDQAGTSRPTGGTARRV